jgi:two-component system sensor histidine kinase KdpD
VLAGLPAQTAVLTQLRGSVTLDSDLLLYLLFVVIAAATGGLPPALAAAIAGTLLVNWFFTPPIHTWTIARGADVLALLVYLGTAAIVSTLVSIAAHRSAEARRANAEAETLAAVASDVVDADPLPVLMTHLRDSFGLAGVSVLRLVEGRWTTETAVGEAVHTPDGADETHDLAEGLILALSGTAPAAQDRRVINAFTANLAAALDRRRLHAQAAEAGTLAEANQLRSSLLQAVSHDLRTPLASIKASVSSLRQHDIAWTRAESTEFLATIEDETDRLTNLVGNLLDMSRVNANAVTPALCPTALDAVVPSALASLGTKAKAVEVDVPDDTPTVYADPALLERVIANLVDNALTYAPTSPVRIDAGSVGDRVLLRVIDRGPGIPVSERERVFLSFQRLGDSTRAKGTGVGLGLAVARGFTQAMAAELSIEDTPGGGVTLVVEIEACK